jgi:HK97 family phage portal protein
MGSPDGQSEKEAPGMKWPWQRKQSAVRESISQFVGVGDPAFMTRNPAQFAKEGYSYNPVVYKCVSLIARSVSSVPIKLRVGGEETEQHNVLDVLKRPNPVQSQAAFIEAYLSEMLIAGNGYCERVTSTDNRILELWTHSPQYMKVLKGAYRLPAGYQWSNGMNKHTWKADPVTGQSDILQIKTFNPLDYWYGMSPMEAAVYGIDNHNAASKWNYKLLKNGAATTGLLTHKITEDEEELTPEQLEKLRKQMADRASGVDSSTTLVLEGNFDYMEMGMNPKDLDWREGKHMSAGEIALVYGVPGQLVGIPDAQTYSNNREARLALWTETIIPIAEMMLGELSVWCSGFYDQDIQLYPDLDGVEALSPLRERKWERVTKAINNPLTINEARQELNLEPVEGGDVLLVQAGLLPITDSGEMMPMEDEAMAYRIAYGEQ